MISISKADAMAIVGLLSKIDAQLLMHICFPGIQSQHLTEVQRQGVQGSYDALQGVHNRLEQQVKPKELGNTLPSNKPHSYFLGFPQGYRGVMGEHSMTDEDWLIRAGQQARAMLNGLPAFMSSPDEDGYPTGGQYQADYPSSWNPSHRVYVASRHRNLYPWSHGNRVNHVKYWESRCPSD